MLFLSDEYFAGTSDSIRYSEQPMSTEFAT